MLIGIDARFYGSAGPGRYVSNLIKNLEQIDKENEYIIFVNKKGDSLYTPTNHNFKKWVADYKWYTMEEQLGFVLELIRARLDLLHVPFLNVPALYPKKMLVTIHDLTMHDYATAASSTLPSFVHETKHYAYKALVNYASFKSKRIIVPTEFVKNDIVNRLWGAKEEKIIVTREGVDTALLEYKETDQGVLNTRLDEFKIKSRYFLYVGSAYKHKNMEMLLISYRDALDNMGLEEQLILAGKIDSYSNNMAGFAHGLRLDDKAIFVSKYCDNGIVTDKDLAYLYQGALAYVFPSLSEGFSITPLEAQSFGVPVLLSDIPAHKEVFGDSVLYFDPNSNIDLTDKMLRMSKEEDLRKDLIQRGYANVQKYSWLEMAKQTLSIYKDILAKDK